MFEFPLQLYLLEIFVQVSFQFAVFPRLWHLQDECLLCCLWPIQRVTKVYENLTVCGDFVIFWKLII